jgi:hypothetical protein
MTRGAERDETIRASKGNMAVAKTPTRKRRMRSLKSWKRREEGDCEYLCDEVVRFAVLQRRR